MSNSTPPAAPSTAVRFGLRGRLLFVTLTVVNLAFAGVWLTATSTARQGVGELTGTNLNLSAANLAAAIARSMDDAYADAITTARLDLAAQALDSGDAKNFGWFADELVRTKRKYAAIVVADTEGEIVGANTIGRDGEPLATPLTGTLAEPWTQRAGESEAGVGIRVPVSRPKCLEAVLAKTERVVGFSLPIIDLLDERIGTVTVFVSLSYFDELLDESTVIADGRTRAAAALLADDGNTLALPTRLPDARWRAANVGASERWTAPDGAAYVVAAAKVAGVVAPEAWRVAAVRTEASVEAPVAAISDALMWAFGVAVGVTTLLLILVASRIVAPILRLTAATTGTDRASDFEPIPVETSDEVGVLTGSFNRMIAALEEYQKGLEDKVRKRTSQLFEAKREVSDILDNMGQAIFTVGPDRTVNSEFSAHCRQVFGEDARIAGTDAIELLGVSADQDQEGHSRMSFWLDNIFGADELQWMLTDAEGVPYVTRNGRELSLSYAPIFEDDVLTKIMVIAKDITDLKDLEATVERQEAENLRNLDRASVIAGMDPDLFEAFLDESENLLEQCAEAARALSGDTDETDLVNKLFRVMHTLKGNARIFGIVEVQSLAHEIEEQLQRIRNGEAQTTPQTGPELLGRVDELRGLIGEFEQLSRQVLGGESAQPKTAVLDALLERAEELPATCESVVIDLEARKDAATATRLVETIGEIGEQATSLGLGSMQAQLAGLLCALEAGRQDSAALAAVVTEVEQLRGVVRRTRAIVEQSAACEALDEYVAEANGLLAPVRTALADIAAGGHDQPREALLSSVRAFGASAGGRSTPRASSTSGSSAVAC